MAMKKNVKVVNAKTGKTVGTWEDKYAKACLDSKTWEAAMAAVIKLVHESYEKKHKSVMPELVRRRATIIIAALVREGTIKKLPRTLKKDELKAAVKKPSAKKAAPKKAVEKKAGPKKPVSKAPAVPSNPAPATVGAVA